MRPYPQQEHSQKHKKPKGGGARKILALLSTFKNFSFIINRCGNRILRKKTKLDPCKIKIF